MLCLPVWILGGICVVIWAIQRLRGKTDTKFWS